MNARAVLVEGVRVLELSPEGPPVHDSADLIGVAWEHQASLVAIPAERLGDSFFKLSSGVAGELVQKFANYRLRLAVMGDISAQLANSNALRSFVHEANRGQQLWFVEDRAALAARLASPAP